MWQSFVRIILIFIIFAQPSPIYAQGLIDGDDVDKIIFIARQYGSAVLAYQTDGNPKIVGQIDNIPYIIRFRNCADGQVCEDMNFRVGFLAKPPIDSINKWNKTKRFTRAYLDSEKDAILEMDIVIAGGISPESLDKIFSYWRLSLASFIRHIDVK